MSYCRVISSVKSSGGISERLFNIAYNAKKHALQTGILLPPSSSVQTKRRAQKVINIMFIVRKDSIPNLGSLSL
jgi:hypothetical protein